MWLNPPRTPIATSTRLEKTYHPCCVYPFHSYPSKKEMIFPPLHTSDSDFIKTNKFFHETFIHVPYECLSHDYASSPGDTLRLQFTVLPRTRLGGSGAAVAGRAKALLAHARFARCTTLTTDSFDSANGTSRPYWHMGSASSSQLSAPLQPRTGCGCSLMSCPGHVAAAIQCPAQSISLPVYTCVMINCCLVYTLG